MIIANHLTENSKHHPQIKLLLMSSRKRLIETELPLPGINSNFVEETYRVQNVG